MIGRRIGRNAAPLFTRRAWLRMAGLFGAGMAVTLVAALGVTGRLGDNAAGERPLKVSVIYVGAEDCAPCQAWRRGGQHAFFASPAFKRIDYREVSSASLFNLLDDEHWPQDLRHFRDRLDKSAGVPMWFVVADGELALTARGLREWNERALPRIEALVSGRRS